MSYIWFVTPSPLRTKDAIGAMTHTRFPLSVENRYGPEAPTQFRAAWYWADGALCEWLDRWARENPDHRAVTDGVQSATAVPAQSSATGTTRTRPGLRSTTRAGTTAETSAGSTPTVASVSPDASRTSSSGAGRTSVPARSRST